MTIKIELTANEADVLIQMIDTAVKTVGLNGAEAGFVLARKISEAAKAAQAVKPVEPEKPAEAA